MSRTDARVLSGLRPNARVLSIIVTLLLGALLAVPVLPAAETVPNYDVLDGVLRMKWRELDQKDEIDLIAQFQGEVTEEDLSTLQGLGFTLYEQYRIIPGVHVKGSKEAVAKLSHYHRAYWLEYNQELSYMLDVSTSTISATDTWNRIIKDSAGSEVLDTSGVPLPIDGSGVCIVVADTGIDATHPDLDYREKVVRNLKKDFDDPLTPWVELPNTDNMFGHGTHCAGISAGNGDASGGERKGVAPGATLIGLGIGDPWETNEIGCFEWVWENSRPGNNPYNIKVMTNSWGYEGAVDESFKDGVIQAANRLTYENNVIVAFAAGNDGGDGSDIRSSPYANQPGMLCVAAGYREGGGVAGFSSRGISSDNATWPDIMAPGVEIWAARDTTGFIVNAVAGDTNPYYTAISGTSMATPHIAGVAALMWQAAPSLKFTQHSVEYTEDHIGEELPGEWAEGMTDIHEMELIFDLTADYIESSGDNGVPGQFSVSHHGRQQDFAQGYGQVNVERAVALALTLEEMRRYDPGATVDDAYARYMNILRSGMVQKSTNAIQKSTNRFVEDTAREQVSWFGEVIELDEIFYPQQNALFIPEATEYLIVDLNYDFPTGANPQSGLIRLTVDKGSGEQNIFLVPDPVDPSHERMVMDVGGDPKDKDWVFEVHNVLGTRTEYLVNFQLVLPATGDYVVDGADYFRFAEEVGTSVIPGLGDVKTRVTLQQNYFDLSMMDEPYQPSPQSHTLTVMVEGGDMDSVSVYRTADPSVMVDSAQVSGSHDFSLPADDLYFVRAQQDGHWDYTSDDVFLSRDKELDIPKLLEKDGELPYIHFSSLEKGDKLEGVFKLGIDAGDEQGVSSIQLFVDGNTLANWNFPNKPEQAYVEYEWDTRDYDDDEYTLKVMVFDAQGNSGEESIKVKVSNSDSEDIPWNFLIGGLVLSMLLMLVAIGIMMWQSKELGWGVPSALSPEAILDAEPEGESGKKEAGKEMKYEKEPVPDAPAAEEGVDDDTTI